MWNDKEPRQGRGAGSTRPPRPSFPAPAPAAEPQPRDPTYPRCSCTAVFSLWALHCGGNIHLVNHHPLPMRGPPWDHDHPPPWPGNPCVARKTTTGLPSGASSPSPACPRHSAGRGRPLAFSPSSTNPPYLAQVTPMNPESRADPRARFYLHVEAKEAYSSPSWDFEQ